MPDGTVPISNADKVVASLRPKFRACYNAGLRVDRTMEGCVVMIARITSEGTVESNGILKIEGLSHAVGACLLDALRGATFSPPGGGGSTSFRAPRAARLARTHDTGRTARTDRPSSSS